jgi:hypothetical protein
MRCPNASRCFKNWGTQACSPSACRPIAEALWALADFFGVVQFLAAEDSVRSSSGLPRPEYLRRNVDRMISAARNMLTASQLEEAQRKGTSMTIGGAISLISAKAGAIQATGSKASGGH